MKPNNEGTDKSMNQLFRRRPSLLALGFGWIWSAVMLLDEATSGVEARSKVGALRRYCVCSYRTFPSKSCLVETISGSQTGGLTGKGRDGGGR